MEPEEYTADLRSQDLSASVKLREYTMRQQRGDKLSDEELAEIPVLMEATKRLVDNSPEDENVYGDAFKRGALLQPAQSITSAAAGVADLIPGLDGVADRLDESAQKQQMRMTLPDIAPTGAPGEGIVEMAGNVLPTIGALLASGWTGGTSMGLVSSGFYGAQAFGAGRDRVRSHLKDQGEETNEYYEALGGFMYGAAEMGAEYAGFKILSRIGGKSLRKGMEKMTKELNKRDPGFLDELVAGWKTFTVGAALEEGSEEAFTEWMQNFTDRYVTQVDPDGSLMQGVAGAFGAGALMGPLVGPAASFARVKQSHRISNRVARVIGRGQDPDQGRLAMVSPEGDVTFRLRPILTPEGDFAPNSYDWVALKEDGTVYAEAPDGGVMFERLGGDLFQHDIRTADTYTTTVTKLDEGGIQKVIDEYNASPYNNAWIQIDDPDFGPYMYFDIETFKLEAPKIVEEGRKWRETNAPPTADSPPPADDEDAAASAEAPEVDTEAAAAPAEQAEEADVAQQVAGEDADAGQEGDAETLPPQEPPVVGEQQELVFTPTAELEDEEPAAPSEPEPVYRFVEPEPVMRDAAGRARQDEVESGVRSLQRTATTYLPELAFNEDPDTVENPGDTDPQARDAFVLALAQAEAGQNPFPEKQVSGPAVGDMVVEARKIGTRDVFIPVRLEEADPNARLFTKTDHENLVGALRSVMTPSQRNVLSEELGGALSSYPEIPSILGSAYELSNIGPLVSAAELGQPQGSAAEAVEEVYPAETQGQEAAEAVKVAPIAKQSLPTLRESSEGLRGTLMQDDGGKHLFGEAMGRKTPKGKPRAGRGQYMLPIYERARVLAIAKLNELNSNYKELTVKDAKKLVKLIVLGANPALNDGEIAEEDRPLWDAALKALEPSNDNVFRFLNGKEREDLNSRSLLEAETDGIDDPAQRDLQTAKNDAANSAKVDEAVARLGSFRAGVELVNFNSKDRKNAGLDRGSIIETEGETRGQTLSQSSRFDRSDPRYNPEPTLEEIAALKGEDEAAARRAERTAKQRGYDGNSRAYAQAMANLGRLMGMRVKAPSRGQRSTPGFLNQESKEDRDFILKAFMSIGGVMHRGEFQLVNDEALKSVTSIAANLKRQSEAEPNNKRLKSEAKAARDKADFFKKQKTRADAYLAAQESMGRKDVPTHYRYSLTAEENHLQAMDKKEVTSLIDKLGTLIFGEKGWKDLKNDFMETVTGKEGGLSKIRSVADRRLIALALQSLSTKSQNPRTEQGFFKAQFAGADTDSFIGPDGLSRQATREHEWNVRGKAGAQFMEWFGDSRAGVEADGGRVPQLYFTASDGNGAIYLISEKRATPGMQGAYVKIENPLDLTTIGTQGEDGVYRITVEELASFLDTLGIEVDTNEAAIVGEPLTFAEALEAINVHDKIAEQFDGVMYRHADGSPGAVAYDPSQVAIDGDRTIIDNEQRLSEEEASGEKPRSRDTASTENMQVASALMTAMWPFNNIPVVILPSMADLPLSVLAKVHPDALKANVPGMIVGETIYFFADKAVALGDNATLKFLHEYITHGRLKGILEAGGIDFNGFMDRVWATYNDDDRFAKAKEQYINIYGDTQEGRRMVAEEFVAMMMESEFSKTGLLMDTIVSAANNILSKANLSHEVHEDALRETLRRAVYEAYANPTPLNMKADEARYSVVTSEGRQGGPTIEDLFHKRMTGAIEKKLSKNSRYSWEEFENAMKNYGIGSNEILWSGLQSVFESREDGKMTGAEIAEVHDDVSAGIYDVALDGIKDEAHELGSIDSRTKLYIKRGTDLVLDTLRQAGMHNHIGMIRAIEFSNDTIRDIRGSADDWLSEVVYDDVDGVELGAEILEEVRSSEWFRTLRGRVLNIGSGDPQESGYPDWIKAQVVKIGDMVSYADNALANSGLPENVVAVMRDYFLDPVYQMYKHLKKSDYYMVATGGDGRSGVGGQSADDFADAVAMGFVSKGLHDIYTTTDNLLDELYVYGIAKRDSEKHSRLAHEIDSALAALQGELLVGVYAPEQYARDKSPRWGAYFPSEFSKNYREILAIASTKERGPINENARLNSTISSHFRDFNGIVYHARVSDVYANGKKLLFIGEVQSDVHQSRRERFKELAKERVYPEDEREREDFRRESSLVQQGIITQKEFEENWPALYTKEQIESMIERDLLPLESTWPRVAVRRLVARAVLEGYDGVALTTGSLIWQNVGGTAQQLHGMKDFYERTLKNTIRKAVGQQGISGRILTDHSVHDVKYAPDGTPMSTYEVTEDMEDSDLGSDEPVLDFVPYWEITEEAKQKVLRGMPMYSLIESVVGGDGQTIEQKIQSTARPKMADAIDMKIKDGTEYSREEFLNIMKSSQVSDEEVHFSRVPLQFAIKESEGEPKLTGKMIKETYDKYAVRLQDAVLSYNGALTEQEEDLVRESMQEEAALGLQNALGSIDSFDLSSDEVSTLEKIRTAKATENTVDGLSYWIGEIGRKLTERFNTRERFDRAGFKLQGEEEYEPFNAEVSSITKGAVFLHGDNIPEWALNLVNEHNDLAEEIYRLNAHVSTATPESLSSAVSKMERMAHRVLDLVPDTQANSFRNWVGEEYNQRARSLRHSNNGRIAIKGDRGLAKSDLKDKIESAVLNAGHNPDSVTAMFTDMVLSARRMGRISEDDVSVILTEFAQSKRRIEDIAEASGMNERPVDGQPKYESWVPKGLRYENYREILTIAYDGKPGPMKELDTRRAAGDRAHFRNSGIVVHSRVMDVNNTRFGKTLFIAEVQSDIHQGQRDRRKRLLEQTVNDGPNEALLDEAIGLGTDEAWAEWESERRTRKRTPEEVDMIMGDPVAPGEGDRYRDIAARRLVARAVLEGYNAIALTSGTMAHSAVGGSIAGQRFFYETKMRSSLEKVLGVKKVGPSAMELSGLNVLEPADGAYGTREAVSFEDDMAGEPIDDMYPVYEITEEAKQKVLRGMPMYSLIEMAQGLPADVRPGAAETLLSEIAARVATSENETEARIGRVLQDMIHGMEGNVDTRTGKYRAAGELPRYTFVGEDSPMYDDIPSARKFTGADGKKRAELDVRPSRLIGGASSAFSEGTKTVSDMLSFDDLFRAVPWMADLRVRIFNDSSEPYVGVFDPELNEIRFNKYFLNLMLFRMNDATQEVFGRSLLLHEVQHAIQRKNGWARGGSNSSNLVAQILTKYPRDVQPIVRRILKKQSPDILKSVVDALGRRFENADMSMIQLATAEELMAEAHRKGVMDMVLKASGQKGSYTSDLLNRAGDAVYDILHGEMEARTVQQNVMENRAPGGGIRYLDQADREMDLSEEDMLIYYSMGDLGSIAWGAATGTYNAGKGAINMLWQLAFGGRDVRRKIWKKIKNSGFNGVRRSVFTSIDRHMRAVADRIRTHNQDAASIIDELMNKLNAAPGYGSSGMTFLEARESATADFMNQLRRAVRHLGFDEGERFSLARVWLDEKNEDRYPEMAEAILAIRNGTIDEISDPSTKRGALELKQLLDDIWSYMDRRLIEHGGMKDFKKLDNYWPRIISSHKVANNLDEFIQELYTGLKEKSPHYTDQKVMDFARAYAESIAFNDNDASEYLMQSGQADAFYEATGELDDNLPAHLKARRLRIDDKYLNNWTINDPIEVMTRYIHRSVQYAELAKRIGPDMGESTLARLSKIAIEDTKEANERLLEAERTGDFEAIERAKVEKKDALKQSEVDRLRNMIYAYQGRLGQGPRSKAGRIAYQGMSSYTALTSLGLVSLAALAEFTAPILTMGGRHGTRSILNALKNIKEGEGFDQEIARQIGTALDQTIEDMMQQYVFSTSTTGSGESGFSRKLGGIMTSFYKWNGLERITRLQRVMATTGARNMIREMLESPRLSVAQEKRAIDLGLPLDAQGRANLLEYVNKLENVSGDQLSKMTSMNPNTNEFHREAEMYRAAVLRIARQTIVHPSAATKPLWMSSRNPFLRLAGQLSTFSIAYREGPIAQWQQEMAQNMEAGGDDWDKLAIMLRLIPLLVAQYAVTEIRRWVTFGTSEDGREVLARIEQDENQLMKNLGIVLDTNVIGSGSRMFHALESAKYGGSVTSYFGGPWTQKVNVLGDAVWAIMDSGDFEPLFKMAGRSIPVVSQIEIARGPFQDVGTAINEQLGTGRQ